MTKKNQKNPKAKKVLETAFVKDVSPFKDMDARENVMDYIKNVLQPENDNLIYKISVDDPEKAHWKKKEHFVKLFHHELKHIEEYYSLSRAERHFLLDLGEFLMWQTNLLVDETDTPLNQTKIATLLETSLKTVQRHMKALEERHIIHKIQIAKEVFYILNPYIMFVGQNINISIPKLFDEAGYINSSMVDVKNSRIYRSKAQENRIIIG